MVGVGADDYFASLGRSHCMGDDDIYLMKILPNLLILDPTEDSLKNDIKNMMEYNGPVYLRCL